MSNALVPLNVINDDKKALTPYKKKKRKFKILKFTLALTTLIIIVFAIYLNFEKILAFFDKKTIDYNTDTESNTNTYSETYTDTITQDPVYSIPIGSFEIIEGGYTFSSVTNNTDFEIGAIEYNPKKASEIYKKYGNEAPVVLIIHSACLESYSKNGLFYSTDDEFYSNDKNIRDIGKALSNSLNELGINTIHIENIFANGGIYSSKEEYEAILKATLEKYPSIEYVFDVSRDIIINDDLTMTKQVCSINGLKMAQMKLWVGSSSKNEFWKSNLSLATMFASKNSDITSEVVLSPFSFCYEVCPQFLKLDIGSYSNTYDEALLLACEASIRIAELIG